MFDADFFLLCPRLGHEVFSTIRRGTDVPPVEFRTQAPGFPRESGRLFALDPGGGVVGQFRGAVQVELALNLFAVVFDGFDAEMEFLGDVASLFPAADELKNLEFAITQAFDGGFGDVSFSTNLLMEHASGKGVADENSSGENPTNGDQDFFEGLIFHEVAESSGAEGDFVINIFVVSADDEDGKFRILGLDVAHEFKTAAVFEGDVRDDKVWLEGGDSGKSFGSFLFFAADDEVALAIDKLSDAVANNGVVIDEQNAGAIIFCRTRFGLGHGHDKFASTASRLKSDSRVRRREAVRE